MSEYSEVIETEGDYRVRIIADKGPEAPEADCEPPLLRIERGQLEFRRNTYGTDGKVREAFDRWTSRPGDDGWKLFVKYLRAYLGVKVIQTWQDSTGVWYVSYDCPAWREYAGLSADDDLSDTDLVGGDWKAYVEGDVWGIVTEKRVTWTTGDEDYEDRETWEETGDFAASWGYYGRKYAEEEARAALKELTA
jgi:hypothetical protein